MATPSEVKAGLDDAAKEIRNARQNLQRAKAQIQAAENDLASIPSKYSDLVDTVNNQYGESDAFEAGAKAELAKLTAEFSALETKAQSAVTALEAIDFSD